MAGLKTGKYVYDNTQRRYEVHFQHDYVQSHLLSGTMGTPPENPPYEFTVSQLCHATHNAQAEEIDQTATDSLYHFKSREKMGKPNNLSYRYHYDGVGPVPPDEETPHYQLILPGNRVFPGTYSWWGLVAPENPQPTPNADYKQPRCLPPYLQTPPQSVYGGNAFKSSLSNLLERYAHSRECEVQNVYLKMGGTLRYKCEIAYVVIVCIDNDLGPLDTYKSIKAVLDPNNPVFDPNGLVNDEGRIQNVQGEPRFTTRFTDTYTSHETLSFAFYFPEQEELQCPQEGIERFQIAHNGERGLCISNYKVWDNQLGRYKCPDN